MDNEEIADALESSNKWWRSGFSLDFKPRKVYGQIKRFMGERQIIALVGLRRTGKTTILLKVAADHMASMERTNIVYFSFDEFRDVKLRSMLQTYSGLMNKGLDSGRYLFLLDEIQKLGDWENQLKAMYDAYPNIKFVISGSESLFIRKRSRESLAGRMYEFQVRTLSFEEYLGFRGIRYDNPGLAKSDVLRELQAFFACNGFPEIIGKDREITDKYLRENVIEKVIYRDIPQILPVKDPAILDQLLRIILDDPGEIMNLDDLAKDLGLSRQTVSLYLGYLEASFLVRKLYNFSRNARKTQRRSKKYYPTVIGSGLLDERDRFGKLLETFAVNETDAEFFWRDAYKNEVDIIKQDPLTAIEVKSGRVSERDLRSIRLFQRRFKPRRVFVLSYDVSGKLGDIPVIPICRYLLEGAGDPK